VSTVKDAVEQVPEQHVFPGAQTTPVATHCAGTVLEDAILGSTCEELSEGVADMLGVGASVELEDGEGLGDGGAELLEDDDVGAFDEDEAFEEDDNVLDDTP
jgi:hypothetical protein